MAKFKCVWLEYPTGNRAFGGGGWSRMAKSRPMPERTEIITTDVVFTSGKSVIVEGLRKIKVNIFKAATGEIVRADYPVYGLTNFGLTTRQIDAQKKIAAKVEKIRAEKWAAAEKAEAEKRAQIMANLPQYVAGWIAAGCVHPAPAPVLAAKQASGMTWTEFERGAACEKI